MTLDDFVYWEEQRELRYEFDGVAVRAMTGGMSAHSSRSAPRQASAVPTQGEWTYAFLDARGVLDLPEAGIAVPLAQIYEDVEFS